DKFLHHGSIGSVEQTHDTVGAGGGDDFAVRAKGDRIESGFGNRGAGDFVDALFFVIVDLFLLVRFARGGNFAHELAQLFGNVIGIIVTAHEQFAGAIQAAGGRDAFAIGAEADAKHASGHGKQIGDELRVVTDLALHFAE